MTVFVTSREANLKPVDALEYREEITLSSVDAYRFGVHAGSYGILKMPNVIPDVPGRDYAVCIKIDNAKQIEPNTLLINSAFYEDLQFGLNREWELHRAENFQPIRRLSLEPSVEQERLREDIKRMRRSSFLERCLYVKPGQCVRDLSLRVTEQAYFNIYDIEPEPSSVLRPTVFGINNETDINLFIPHRKGGIDMVIVVDASLSMNLADYVNARGECKTRIWGAKRALETLLAQRLYSGSRVSRFALVAFGKDAQVIYPPNSRNMVEMSPFDVDAMRRELPYIARRVDRSGTDIAEAMDTAADLLYNNAREDNEKVIVLLSDGAHWNKEQDTETRVEVRVGHDDPVMFADNLFDEGQIRIHTVAISNEANLRRYVPQYAGHTGSTPNPEMLSEIAKKTQAKFFPSPDAEVLNKLFEDLGKGAIFPVLH